MKLTEKQERFCLAYIETGNASEAYRQAYDTERMADSTIARNAKTLMDGNKITARIESLREPVRERAQLTLEQHLEDLKRLRDKSEQEGKYTAAITAEVNRGKASGLYVDRLKHEGSIVGDLTDLMKQISDGSA